MAFAQKLENDSAVAVHSMGPEYLPFADSLQSTLAFLNKNPQLLSSTNGADQANAALAQLQRLESKLQDADQIKAFIQQRKAQIKQYFSQYTKLPPGVSNIYSDYNKQLYYYSTEVKQFRETLNDPDKMMTTALTLLDKLPAFTSFMKKNSFLAGLFNVPAGYGERLLSKGFKPGIRYLQLFKAS